MDLSIITVNYNGKNDILNQIASAREGACGLEYEQIISDNGSTDESVLEIKRLFPNVKVIENGSNLGFATANNLALPYVSGEFILFLNPDMRVAPDSLKKLIDWMRAHPEVGIASPKLTDEEGKFNKNSKPRRFPNVLDQTALLLKIPHIFPKIINHYHYSDFNPEIEQEVDSVRGSFMLMRRAIIQKLGWAFDPRYFIWFEDVDICRETKRLGYKVVYTPIISCVDRVGQSFKHLPDKVKQRWFTKSMVLYFKKWEPKYKFIWITVLRPIAILMVDIATCFRK
ncbi:MAG: glycosyltransferase family 2 protein [Patescibacteria group bacterium]|nr:glycosyltransferase family 2 protein [Patescibacteria group bacterium]